MIETQEMEAIQKMMDDRVRSSIKGFADLSATAFRQQQEQINVLTEMLKRMSGELTRRDDSLDQNTVMMQRRIPTPSYTQDAGGAPSGEGPTDSFEFPGVPYLDGDGNLVTKKFTLSVVNGVLSVVSQSETATVLIPAGASGELVLQELAQWSAPTLSANTRALTITAGRITGIGEATGNTIDTAVACPNA